MPPITVRVRYFGMARDMAGRREERFALEAPALVRNLLDEAQARHGGLARLRTAVRVAVDEELAEETTALRGGETVVILPPVAGG